MESRHLPSSVDCRKAASSFSQLWLAADEGRVDTSGEGGHVRKHLRKPQGGNGFGLSLEGEGLERLDPHCVADEDVRLLAEQDLARRRHLLEAGGDVDRVTGDERLAVTGDDIAGIHTDANLQVERLDRIAHLGRGPHRTQRVILVDVRKAEHRHDRITDELLDRATVVLEDSPQLRVVTAHDASQRLRIQPLPKGGRARQIHEDDGHSLAHLARLGGKRRAAGAAEACRLGIFSAAARAGQHTQSVRRRGRGCYAAPRPTRAG